MGVFMIEKHIDKILFQVNSFIEHSELKNSLSKLPEPENKIVILNNSFLFREKVKTIKNEKYLAVIPTKLPVKEENCFIVTGPSLKTDYSISKITDKKIIVRKSLTDSINDELSSLGEIVFVLMGEIDENISISDDIDHEIIKKITFSPKENKLIRINKDQILLKSLDDEEHNWNVIENELNTIATFDKEKIENLKQKIGKVFDNLKKKSFLNLIVPQKYDSNKKYFLELIGESINEQLQLYKKNISELSRATEDRQRNLNDILRISYNFVDDATTLIRLIISVCDLKPIILWETFNYHFLLNESIRLLPWTRDEKKPSLSKYIDTIKKARNKSFHRLIPFSKAFEVQLPEKSIKNANIRIFSEHGSKTDSNRLDYKDKELVDVLMVFTRTSDEIVSNEFWEKNTFVIDNTIKLLNETASVIRDYK